MAVPFSNTKLRVPRGFQNLLEGLAREVLRSQPEELYEFGAQYFENLIKQREGKKYYIRHDMFIEVVSSSVVAQLSDFPKLCSLN